MSPIHGFAPIASPQARVLILGSMPSAASLTAHQYYAHPRNAFWKIMGELTGAGPALPYESRTKILVSQGIAVWDVFKSCVREGSLDTAIDGSSAVHNDFETFFARHGQIKHVFFNGGKAQSAFMKCIHADISGRFPHLQYHRLPSTSPAHASLTFAQKLEKWRLIETCFVPGYDR